MSSSCHNCKGKGYILIGYQGGVRLAKTYVICPTCAGRKRIEHHRKLKPKKG